MSKKDKKIKSLKRELKELKAELRKLKSASLRRTRKKVAKAQKSVPRPRPKPQAPAPAPGTGTRGHRHTAPDVRGTEKNLSSARSRAALKRSSPNALSLLLRGFHGLICR